MPIEVHIDGVGVIEFPDDFAEDQIKSALDRRPWEPQPKLFEEARNAPDPFQASGLPRPDFNLPPEPSTLTGPQPQDEFTTKVRETGDMFRALMEREQDPTRLGNVRAAAHQAYMGLEAEAKQKGIPFSADIGGRYTALPPAATDYLKSGLASVLDPEEGIAAAVGGRKPELGTVGGTIAGTAGAVDDLATALLQPEIVTAIGIGKLLPAAGRAIGIGFAGDMLAHMPAQAKTILDAWRNGDVEGSVRHTLGLIGSGFFSRSLIKHGFSTKGEPNAIQPESPQFPGGLRPRNEAEQARAEVPAEEGGPQAGLGGGEAQTGAGGQARVLLRQTEIEELADLRERRATLQNKDRARLQELEERALAATGTFGADLGDIIERAAIDSPDPVKIVDTLPAGEGQPFGSAHGNSPFTIDAEGNILIVADRMASWIKLNIVDQGLGKKGVEPAVRAQINEEGIHLRTDPDIAGSYWEGLPGYEQAMVRERYALGGPIPEVSDVHWGMEALRFRMQQAMRMTPTEFTLMARKQRWTWQALTALETAVRAIREKFTNAGREQKAIFERMLENIDHAKLAIGPSPSGPGRDESDWPSRKEDPDWDAVQAAHITKKIKDLEALSDWHAGKADTDSEMFNKGQEALAMEAQRRAERLKKMFPQDQRSFPAGPGRGLTKKELDAIKLGRMRLEAQGIIPEHVKEQREKRAAEKAQLELISEHPSATEMGALPRLNASDITKGAAIRMEAIEPSFKDFSSWAKRNVEGIRDSQLREVWEDAVWKHTLNATPERLSALRREFGLESHYGRRDIAPQSTGKQEFANTDARNAFESRQRYRSKVVQAIATKLIKGSMTERPGLDRKEVTVDDVDFSNEKTKHGAYTDIGKDVADNPDTLFKILRDQARASNTDPESASRRLVAVVDRKTGDVNLLSTYNDAGVQRVTNPSGPMIAGKPSMELNAMFLKKYRPFASVLLEDPVKGFRQRFATVGEFMDKIGTESAGRSRVGEFPGEEAGAAESATEGATGWAKQHDLTSKDLVYIKDHIVNEVGKFESPDDVKLSLAGLADSAASGKISAAERVTVGGYRKLFDALAERYPDATTEDLLDRMARKIYENHEDSKTTEDFVRNGMEEFGAKDKEDVRPGPEARPSSAVELEARPPRGTVAKPGRVYTKEEWERIQKNRAAMPSGPGRMSDKVKDLLRSPVVVEPEAIFPDVSSPIPRFIPNVSGQLTRAMGIERIPLIGRLWGPRAKVRDAMDRDILGYSVKRTIGRSQSSLIGKRLDARKEELGNPFKQDKDGKFTNVKARPGQSLFPSDLFEDWQRQQIVPDKMKATGKYSDAEIAAYVRKNPETMGLNANQAKLFREMLSIITDGYKYLEEKNAKLDMYGGESKESRAAQQTMVGLPKGIEWYPLPRVALHKRSTGPIRSEIQRRIGGKYDVEIDRLYKTEDQGQRTTVYEPDMTKRTVTFVDRIYKSVADADLANSEALKGETPAERSVKLAKEFEAKLRSGEMTQEDIHEMSRRPRLGIEAAVSGHPAFEGKIYTHEIGTKLQREFGHQAHEWLSAATELSTFSKAFMLTGDLAQYLQQGAPLMIRRPGAWGVAVSRSLKSLADPNVTGKYLQNPENYQAATELAQGGVSLGHLQDFMHGAEPGEFASRIPIPVVGPAVRQIVTRSGRSFGTFFDVSKIETWKALREVTPRDQWPQVMATIENTVLSGRMEAAGLHPGRAAAERVMLMAAAYYRGGVDLVAGMAEKGVAGKEARMVVGSYMAGITLAMTGLYLLAGMSWDEIKKRLTPGTNNQKFLSYPVKVGAKTIEIGPGGILLQFASLATDIARDPKSLVNLGPKNPLLKFLMTKLGPFPSVGLQVATGENVYGQPTTPAEAGVRLLTPIGVQKGVSALGKGNLDSAMVQAGASFFGLQAGESKAMHEIGDLANRFMRDNGLKKETGWETRQVNEPSYGRLRAAIGTGRKGMFEDAYEGLLKTHTMSEIKDAMRTWKDRPFTGSLGHEPDFRASLNPYEDRLYEQAQEERLKVWEQFLEFEAALPLK